MKRYKLITHEGKVFYKKRMSLKSMQKFVGGYIEQVGNIICNEEGNIYKLPINLVNARFVGNIIEIEEIL